MKPLRIVGAVLVSIGGLLVGLLFVSLNRPDLQLPFGWMFFLSVPLAMFGLAIYTVGALKKCPHCIKLSNFAATICGHCHREFIAEKPVEWPAY